ncbi:MULTISPECIES: thioredoxin family protein [unclassified Streptomyces]|uniref:TlpA family protein disulfide reductase n=1 Tax=unclassified Streptomyces TaxID=2593676 RepID=UPI00081E4DEE|nr:MULTISPECIES: thioredoxin family protein [unclassified Streptomyces]MYZ37649.1 thioredoxin [Streptomyces sp. SID4917]SCF92950.1 Thiol-disulfide isomerase or thioredoxin [Streptomyces sp. MnatMP-M17]
MTGLVVCAAVLAVASAFGLLRRRVDGRLKMRVKDGEKRFGAAELGAELGERATLVQFSSAFCQPCRATRRTLSEVAGMVDGVSHVELDAEERLELVRELGILKTPTVLVLDAAGRIVKRAAGQPRKADVIAALGEAV